MVYGGYKVGVFVNKVFKPVDYRTYDNLNDARLSAMEGASKRVPMEVVQITSRVFSMGKVHVMSISGKDVKVWTDYHGNTYSILFDGRISRI